jgi:hypothetical protein
MSFEITDLTTRLVKSGLSYNAKYTLCGWFRAATGCNGYVFTAGSGTSGGIRSLYFDTTNGFRIRKANSAFITPDATFNPAVGDWVYVAMYCNGYTHKAYGWTEDNNTSTPSVTFQNTVDASAATAVSQLNVCQGVLNYYDGAKGQYRYWRFFDNIELSLADLLAEKNATTPATNAASCKGSWKLPDATDYSDDSGVGNSLSRTGTGNATSASEPTLSAGPSAVIPPLLTPRQVAPFTIHY